MAPAPLRSLCARVRVPGGFESPSLAGKWRPLGSPYAPVPHAGDGAGHPQFPSRPLAQDWWFSRGMALYRLLRAILRTCSSCYLP